MLGGRFITASVNRENHVLHGTPELERVHGVARVSIDHRAESAESGSARAFSGQRPQGRPAVSRLVRLNCAAQLRARPARVNLRVGGNLEPSNSVPVHDRRAAVHVGVGAGTVVKIQRNASGLVMGGSQDFTSFAISPRSPSAISAVAGHLFIVWGLISRALNRHSQACRVDARAWLSNSTSMPSHMAVTRVSLSGFSLRAFVHFSTVNGGLSKNINPYRQPVHHRQRRAASRPRRQSNCFQGPSRSSLLCTTSASGRLEFKFC